MEPETAVSEPAIEPQVKQEPELAVLAESPAPTPVSGAPHHYSTRSKENNTKTAANGGLTKSQLLQKQHNVVVHSRLKPVPFKQHDLLVNEATTPSKVFLETIHETRFFLSDEHPFNKRGFKYKPCRANPAFPSNLYSTTDIPPYSVRPSFFDRSQGVLFSDDWSLVSTQDGWRSVRANLGVREGKYFMEFNVVNANNSTDKGHVRIGIARKEASLEAPVGFDGYGYALRDLNGQKITLSRPKEFMAVESGGFSSGDTIGFLVDLPLLKEHRESLQQQLDRSRVSVGHNSPSQDQKSPKKKRKIGPKKPVSDIDAVDFSSFSNISRDQIPIKYRSSLYYEQYEYTTTKQMEHLLNPVTVFGEKAFLEQHATSVSNLPTIPGSRVVVYKNGEKIGTMFEDLFSFLPFEDDTEVEVFSNTKQLQNSAYRNTDDGSLGYYPMLLVFQKGVVGLNPGPDFKYPLKDEEGVKPLSDRYAEAVVDEWYWDILDEVEAEYLDSFDV